jgi:hypothetical protein
MKGDDVTRHCRSCKKNVYDISSLSEDEAIDLINEKEGLLCVKFFQRSDGTILTEDCPVGLRNKIKYAYLRTVLMLFALFGLSSSTSCNEIKAKYFPSEEVIELKGDVCLPIMGKVAPGNNKKP